MLPKRAHQAYPPEDRRIRIVDQETAISRFEALARRFSPSCAPFVSFVVQDQTKDTKGIQERLEWFCQSFDAGQETGDIEDEQKRKRAERALCPSDS